ncbi:jmjC domain-containing protein 5 [Pogonomyrmex barbatus]|uniref:JmjC domain-containing protein 5 n=1 Tax=Pogonomyrmex barbatus TaxID=144034 RepID=A0A8N1S9B3_9HYME|nr:jmjC domain-containing protein 5 [Pogonomyrmex barbatus]
MTCSDSIITVPWESLTKELEYIPIEIRLHLASIINILQSSDKQITSEKWINTSLIRLEACLDRTWEVLNSGYWKNVPIEYRYCYSLCIIIKVLKYLGCIHHWKALTLWKNPNYLNKIAGSRTVPIEIGSRYTEEDWTQHLVNFSEFLQKHVIENNSEIGYLAQHQLFEQIPELKKDFEVPEYCCFLDSEENDAEIDINAWFGPANTVSPLHFDPKNNLLSQIFGYKRVILYSPAETNNLYPYDTRLLNNTAQVDPVRPDYDKWPNFRKASGMTFYLKPGEMLYIPPKWWHHVTALTPSFSVSFWWN